MLTHWGFSTVAAMDGREALARLENATEDQQPPRLILLDVQMPEMDGFRLAERIRGNPHCSECRIIILTSIGQRGDVARCKDLGISSYLMKPIKQAELRHAITMALGKSSETVADFVVTRYTLREADRSYRLLLAEDNAVSQRLIMRMLQKRGHYVVAVASGAEALDALEKDRFDMVLMDIQMPEMDGLEATRLIRAREQTGHGHVPVIALTAHAMQGDRERCLEAGMDDYLSKPVKMEELFELVKKWGERPGGTPP
jgi:CheY-like chemotaxis protein